MTNYHFVKVSNESPESALPRANCKFVRKTGLLGRFAKYTLSEPGNNRLHAYTNWDENIISKKGE